MMDMKLILGLIAVAMTVYGHGAYIRGILRGKVTPHIFTWGLWALLNGIAFFAQISDGAGYGAWTTGVTALLLLAITALALKHGEKDITRSDWALFLSGLAAIPLWVLTDDPLASVILISAIDAVAFGPTLRKTWRQPGQEMALTYGISAARHVIALASLAHISLVTALFPFTLLVMNGLLFAIVLLRRRMLNNP